MRPRRSTLIALTAAFALIAAACGGQSIDPSGGTTSASAGGGEIGGAGGGTPIPEVDVTLLHGSASQVVNLAALPTTTFKDATVVKLGDVWAAGGLQDDTSSLGFDFEGDDGFHPSSKPACSKLITPAQLDQGFITPDTRVLIWPDSLGFSGCYFVKGVAKITGVDSP